MGIPYSRQINAAFDQVTPLVAQGYRVLETTKNIAILLALIQVLTVALLSLILTALIALLITMNPKLANERDIFVTPTMKMLVHQGALVVWATGGAVVFGAMIGGLYLAIFGRKLDPEEGGEEEEDETEDKESDEVGSGKSGETK
jgi:predicted membrane protein